MKTSLPADTGPMPATNPDLDRPGVPDGHGRSARPGLLRSRDQWKWRPAGALAFMFVVSIMLWYAIAGLSALLLH